MGHSIISGFAAQCVRFFIPVMAFCLASGGCSREERFPPAAAKAELLAQARSYIERYLTAGKGVRISKYLSIDSVHTLDFVHAETDSGLLEAECRVDMTVIRPFGRGSDIHRVVERYFMPEVDFSDKKLRPEEPSGSDPTVRWRAGTPSNRREPVSSLNDPLEEDVPGARDAGVRRRSPPLNGFGFGSSPDYEYERTTLGDRYFAMGILELKRVSDGWRVIGLKPRRGGA
ncbi:MAG: hypothetical protein WB626_04405 [Bacteroidota bacterium]